MAPKTHRTRKFGEPEVTKLQYKGVKGVECLGAIGMSQNRPSSVLWPLSGLFRRGRLDGVGEGRLIDRFVEEQDGDAFAVLMERHGPMVLGVCRRILTDERDVEDAFQATFLLLVQKAGTLRDRESLGPWLYGVARRVSVRARSKALRRSQRERSVSEEAAVMSRTRELDIDLRSVLDDELGRLPARMRSAVVLCDLEGIPQAEAAQRLGCALGTIKSRLNRAHARLRTRLVRRGVVPAAVAASSLVHASAARASVPKALAASTLTAATRLAAGTAVSAHVTDLVGEVARTMTMGKLRAMFAMVLTSAVLAAGTFALARQRDDKPPRQGDPTPVTSSTRADVPPARTPPGFPDSDHPRSLTLTVVEVGTRQPISGAQVEVRLLASNDVVFGSKTDRDGRSVLSLPVDNAEWILVGASRDGYVPASLSLDRRDLETATSFDRTLVLERGIAVGGAVHNVEGKAIEGVKVIPAIFADDAKTGSQFFSPEAGVAVTDARGRWQASILPRNAKGPLYVRLVHPGYVSDILGFSRSIPVPEAKAMSAVMVMHPGKRLTGRVVGPDGNPVPAAPVVLALSHTRGDCLRTTSDGNGRFHFDHVEDRGRGGAPIAADVPGYAPTWIWAAFAPPPSPEALESSPVTLRLVKGHAFHGRVVDTKGQPVERALVSAQSWEECSQIAWQTQTDTDGRFTWADAPITGDVYFRVTKPGYAHVLQQKLAANATAPLITLHRGQVVHGSVVDASTGRAIELFDVVPGTVPKGVDEPPSWWRPGTVKGLQGAYTYHSSLEQGSTTFLRVEAQGYFPKTSRGIAIDEENVVVDFQLERTHVQAPDVTGVVRLPDGTPLQGAEVYLATELKRLQLRNGRPERGLVDPGMSTRSGPDGRFSFKNPGERAVVIVIDDLGFVQRDVAELAKAPDLTIEPWARIEGTLRVGGRPGAGKHVNVEDYRSIMLELHCQLWGYGADADAQGHFTIERVMPSDTVYVERRIDWRLGRLTAISTPSFAIKPGETVQVELGGTGRPVIGRVTRPDGEPATGDFSRTHVALSLKLPEIPRPADFNSWNAQRQREFMTRFWESPAGQARRLMSRKYAATVSPEGTFRIEDVVAGTYELLVEDLTRPRYEPGATARRLVQVGEIPGDRTDEALELGRLELVAEPEPVAAKQVAVKPLRVGQPAPAFTVKTLDGKPLRLEDYRGKFVLLEFWATWCIPCRRQEPFLKAAFREFGNDPRFALISLSLDEAVAAPAAFTEKRGLDWTHGILGEPAQATVLADYGVAAIPMLILIGPDGTVLARDLRDEGIREAIVNALTPQ